MNKNKCEAFFDGAYLLFDLVAAIIFFMHGHQSIVFTMYGCLALLLGGGDAFHLIPHDDLILCLTLLYLETALRYFCSLHLPFHHLADRDHPHRLMPDAAK